MKKLFFILALMCVTSFASAQVRKYKATDFSCKTVNNGRWSNWSNWQKCNILIVINFGNEKITIYSQTAQEYDIISYDGESSDGEGGSQFTLQCVDATGVRCAVRNRTQRDGQKQIYIDYADASWVYCIEEK